MCSTATAFHALRKGRLEQGGRALMILTVDGPLEPDVLERIKKDADMEDGWFVQI